MKVKEGQWYCTMASDWKWKRTLHCTKAGMSDYRTMTEMGDWK